MHSALDWDDLRLVLAVAKERTLSGAARSLGITHSTVFRRLGAIERQVGVRLFERFRDGYVPTAAGEAAAALGQRFAEGVLALERRISGQDQQPSGTVRITTTDTVSTILIAHLPALRRSYPEIALELAVSNNWANLTRREADIALRPTLKPPEILVGRRIADIAHAIYGSPTYLSGHTDTRLPVHDWLGLDDSLGATAIGRWMRENVPPARLVCRVDALPALGEAARAGLGLAVLPCYLGDATPGLQRVMSKTISIPLPRSALWLLTHDDLKRTARIRAVMDFLAAAFAAERPLLEDKREPGNQHKNGAAKKRPNSRQRARNKK